MPRLDVDIDTRILELELALAQESYTSLRAEKVISRSVSDALSAAEGTSKQPVEVVFAIAGHLGCAPTDITVRGTFAELALRHPAHVPFALADYDGDDYSELVAMPIGLGRAKQLEALARKTNPANLAVSVPVDQTGTGENPLDVLEAERMFFENNPTLYEPVFEWHSAIENDQLVANEPLLSRIEEELSPNERPSRVIRIGGNRHGVANLVENGRRALTSTSDVRSDLNYPEHNLRIFHAWQMRYFQVSLELEWKGLKPKPAKPPRAIRKENTGNLVAHNFISSVRIPFHHFVIGPANADFVYLRGEPTYNRACWNFWRAGDESSNDGSNASDFRLRSSHHRVPIRISGVEALNPALAASVNNEEVSK